MHDFCLRYISVVLVVLVITGCKSVYEIDSASDSVVRPKGTLVFVRPDKYTILGTRSLRDYCEILYEKKSVNQAGQTVVSIGLRNRGGQHWWDTKGPKVVLYAKADFYESPLHAGQPSGPPVYKTNWRRFIISRGETIHFEFVSPVPADGYQVTISDGI